MGESLIKLMFSIIATLVVSLLLFALIFTADGQQLLWGAIKPPMEEQWRDCTMDNGAKRTQYYEDVFADFKNIEYNRNR